MKRITIFCGSSSGTNELYHEQEYLLGQVLAKQKTGVVYGGAKVGIMGAVADGALSEGGEVIGVIPDFLQKKELAHKGLTELIVVKTMHQRKLKMNDLCDGVIALAGGFGTLEELFEMLTWAQLGLHKKPIGILNTNGYYDALITFIQNMVDNGFLKEVNQKSLLVSDEIYDLIDQMNNYVAPDAVEKWITRSRI